MFIKKWHRHLTKNDDAPTLARIVVLLISSFIFQGVGYMDTTERRFKLVTDIGFTAVFTSLFTRYLRRRQAIGLSLGLAHAVNWLVNGQIPCVLKHFDLIRSNRLKFQAWMDEIGKQAGNEPAIAAAVAYGSLSRGELSETSDLDVRLIRRPGVWNGICASVLTMRLRCRATREWFPLDIYVLDGVDSLDRLRDDEPPIVLADNDELFDEHDD